MTEKKIRITLIGEKIKASRKKAGMTQTELSGGFITRNMLSRIENGSALPSIDTLYYLANKLQISAGYFLMDSNDDFLFHKAALIEPIKEKLAEREYSSCIQLCSVFGGREDDEILLILAECFCNIAVEEFENGKLTASKNALSSSLHYAARTVYPTQYIESVCLLFAGYMNTFGSGEEGRALSGYGKLPLGDIAFEIFSKIKHSDLFFYLHILKLLDENDIEAANRITESGILRNSAYTDHIKAKKAMMNENRRAAIGILTDLLYKNIGKMMKINIYSDLVYLFNAERDYENAYDFSQKKQELEKTIR